MLKKVLVLGSILGLGFVLLLLTTQNSRFEVESEAFVGQGPQQVWTQIEDVNGWHRWWPGVERAHLTGPVEVGARFELIMTGQSASDMAIIKQIEPPRTLAWQREGVFGSLAGTELSLSAEGTGSRVRFKNYIHGPQAFLARLTGREAFARYQQKLLDSLRVYLDVKVPRTEKKD